ncbi:peptidoglycan-associated lipoprotein Pal [uncultured Ramlibacter sp.]|uniref:peptidoglycan-associated lipoprotein Pal n=1 Tax=uncultured Ramlibacter sp. TaxID=260755 RepID=UPI002617E567|nr:peptidoglycan-associated lipoprotein Pal [uncultured Ramlibacter sp.]
MIKRFLFGLALAAALAGCGSNVKLDDVPVEDKSGSSVGTGAGTGGATQSGVTPVAVDPARDLQPGPAGVARVIYFDYDSNAIKAEFQPLIEGHARFLKADAKRKITVEGNTDERGGREYNLALGQRRSEAVRSALKLLGVADSQIEAVSFGKEKPVDAGSDEAAWAKNRRAEIAYR